MAGYLRFSGEIGDVAWSLFLDADSRTGVRNVLLYTGSSLSLSVSKVVAEAAEYLVRRPRE